MQPLNVAFGPYNPMGNPYQRLLAEHLRDESVNVSSLPVGARFGKQAGPWQNAKVVHFHWFDKYILGSGSFKTSLKCRAMRGHITKLKKRGVRFVWTAHNLKNHQRRFIEHEHKFMTWFLERCDAVIAHAESAKTEVAKHYPDVRGLTERTHVIPHGNYIDVYSNEIDRERARAELKILSKRFVFLFIGQVHPYKGVRELIATFKSLLENDAFLLIAGKASDAEFEHEIEGDVRLSEDQIAFHPGFVPDEKLQIYLNAADVVVLPFTEILTSGSAVLAMSFGKPIIAPRHGCLPEMLGGQESLLYDPKKENGLFLALHDAMEARERLNDLGRVNIEKARQWDWQMVAKRTAEVYHGLNG